MKKVQYGIVIGTPKNSVNSVSVCTNDGKELKYNKSVKDIHYGDRVRVRLNQDGQLTGIQKQKDETVRGRVIWVYPGGGGLVQTKSGETLSFTRNHITGSCTDPVLGQNVRCTASPAPRGVKKPLGTAKNLKLYPIPELTAEWRRKGGQALRNRLGVGVNSIENALKVLRETGLDPDKFGYTDRYMFLEAFTDVLRVQHEKNTVQIFDAAETEDCYRSVLAIANRIGYDHLTALQERAVRDPAFWSQNRVLVMGTTSAGKTMIPMFKFIHERETTEKRLKMLIAVPYRALAWQMYQSFCEKFGDDGLDIACSTSERTDRDDDILQGDVDSAIIIYEKLFLFLSENSWLLNRYDYLTLDEIGLVQEKERGVKTELVNLHAFLRPDMRITMLATPYFNWESYVDQYQLYPIKCFSRPVPIREYFLMPCKEYNETSRCENIKYHLYDSQEQELSLGHCKGFKDTLYYLCRNERELGHKVIAFCFSKRTARRRVRDIYEYMKNALSWTEPTSEERAEFKERFFLEYNLTPEELKGVFDQDIEFDALMKGITFHCASLPEAMRIAIESEFLDTPRVIEGGVRLVVATETLAFGLNSNVDTIIMTHMKKAQMGGEEEPLEYNLYQNCIGRAGRLGYLNFGTSYTFIPIDMIPQSDCRDSPVKRYSSKSALDVGEVYSQLGGLLSEPQWENLAFCVLNLFREGRAMTQKGICDRITQVPVTTPLDKERLQEAIDKAVQFLCAEKLLEVDESDILMEDEQDSYVLTRRGCRLRSYTISTDSYRIIQEAIDLLFAESGCCVLDYFLKLSQCAEIGDFCKNMMVRPPENGEVNGNQEENQPLEDLIAFVKLAEGTLPEIRKNGYISENLYHSFVESETYTAAKAYAEEAELLDEETFCSKRIELPSEGYDELTQFRVALYSTLWISGYSLGLINDIAGWTNGKVDNIKSKFGEKMSYVTDAAAASASLNGLDTERSELLLQISFALFYGIRLEWIRREELTKLKLGPEKARSYHIASIWSGREAYLKKNGTPQQWRDFEEEDKFLDDEVKQILQKDRMEG